VAAVQGGGSPNDLKDQRDVLVQKLGEMAGATVKQGKDGSVDVFLGAAQLVAGRNAGTLAVAGTATTVTPAAAPGTTPAPPAVAVTVGGAAAGLIDGIDNVLPRYTQGLEDVMERLTQDVNEQHTKGSTGTGAAGTALFEVTGKRLQVLITEPGDIAASATPGGTTTGDAGGGNASKLAAIAGRAGGADVIYRGLVVQLGVEAQTAIRRTDIQSGILAQVDSAREAQSGVNLDEEMTNMLAFQRAYEGAARFVTSVDQMLDTLINRTGLVGR
jgi:flagellar hook-associated protein 1 FlgK